MLFQYYGFTRLTANATTLIWEFIHNDDNKVYDYLVLTKSDGSGSIRENNEEGGDNDGPAGEDRRDEDKDDDKKDDDDGDKPENNDDWWKKFHSVLPNEI